MRPTLRVPARGRDARTSGAGLAASDDGVGSGAGGLVLRDPGPVELVWMEELRVHLRSGDVDVTSVQDLSRLFDTYCRTWHATAVADRWDPGYVISALGVTLGDALIAGLDRAPVMDARSSWIPAGEPRWMVAGQRATTVAVRDDTRHTTIFPVDAVARRWISAETGWMDAFVTSVCAPPPSGPARRVSLSSLRRSPGERRRRR